MIFRIGTRGSDLARWQARHVADLLQRAHPQLDVQLVIINTRGDQIINQPLPQIGGKGLFTQALENALYHGEIDCAVHSLKDLPTENPDGIQLGAIPPRGAVADVLVSLAGYTMDTLPKNAIVGTSSLRRAAQIKCLRPDISIQDIRGNVPTRLQKAADYDAIVLAQAGLERLNLTRHITQILTDLVPAPGQGALGVQCREDDTFLSAIDDPITRLTVTAERDFLKALGGGCAVPVGALSTIDGDTLRLHGRINSVDGTQQIDVFGQCAVSQVANLAQLLATQAIQQGGKALLG
ncbi:MAG: hydroxymethylbilane synthase [Phototrophicales bacterium]|nr:MAG: hydroxymethylbilane synthase [Phototrophicales bacterium]RMG74892.1 MAG: hydroxymethylbilane synthase [Chloroflexota bacterium]